MNFEDADALFRKDKIRELAAVPEGLRFLKLRSLSRTEYLKRLFSSVGMVPSAAGQKAMFRQAYQTAGIDSAAIDRLVRSIYEQERASRRQREPELVSQLYHMAVFDWGGLHQNSLEKAIVDNYVKKITDYDALCDKIENELHTSMRGYVLCSWYNHWASIIIQDVFCDHPSVLPAVGQIKKVDFFINDVPFDLKVTYFPEGFIAERRRVEGLRPELTMLRQSARRAGIHFDSAMPAARLTQDLWAKHRDHPSSAVRSVPAELNAYRVTLLEDCQREPTPLIRWLYENQGFRRFDASTRLFLILVDKADFFESWKLKRAKPLLDDRVHSYLHSVGSSPGRQVSFTWEGDNYQVLSDAVFIVRE